MSSTTTTTCDGCGGKSTDGSEPVVNSYYVFGESGHVCKRCWNRMLRAAKVDNGVLALEERLAAVEGERDQALAAYTKNIACASERADALQGRLDEAMKAVVEQDRLCRQAQAQIVGLEATIKSLDACAKNSFAHLGIALMRQPYAKAVVEDARSYILAAALHLEDLQANGSDARDEIEWADQVIPEIIAMLGKKRRRKNTARLVEIERLMGLRRPVAHTSVRELMDRAKAAGHDSLGIANDPEWPEECPEDIS